jgi:exodeoxyribonuclease V beta subunit
VTPKPSGKPKRAELDRVVSEQGQERFLEARGQVTFEFEHRPPQLTSWGGSHEDQRPLAVHSTPEPTRAAWQIASFTSLSHVALARAEEQLTLEELPELDESVHGKVLAPIEYHGPQPPLIGLSGSARFGQCLHALLERLDFRHELTEVERLTEALLRAWGFDLHLTGQVARGIWLALQTPLAMAAPLPSASRDDHVVWREHSLKDICLCDLPREMRRDEMQFELPIASEIPLSGSLLNRILRLDPACHELPTFPDDFQLQGFLKGSIDLLFRVERGGVMRYYLADYKSHWLGDESGSQLGHYHPEALRLVMNTHLYHVQSHFYQVVLYRLLRDRLGHSYHHPTQFGGSLYLFLRGMAGKESRILAEGRDYGSAGVYVHRPPQHVTELLSLALDRPEEALQRLDNLFSPRSAMRKHTPHKSRERTPQ